MDKIGKVAARLFSKLGYLETTMYQIAEASKLSKGGTYYYFNSKAEVLFYISDNYLDKALENLDADLSDFGGSEEKLDLIIS
ncbi:MAG: TetR/AcrR family transcriptional regulator, partial [Thermodesulfobacteriota bacterium]|nr:TetR/AcrR family transcriptional regulator [Thermodesulfobacteriota bacterium]